ncbi:acetyl-CoA carboxylase biotin carboxyl carrier protein [Lactobacillus sp. ESL0261]|uniref:acetyl-CoA carboxylase biotin carboxyl carrier protein n=1 Tax=Lactobacillus sp. ESL0261 TaxID=2069348 RepID=UPI000EFAA7D1|nr:acetyl-CoA carboxylase biotin carboxyl carrier protein [Lactobacillus sp. ESL0261]RMC53242.1 acetyl-CoA carboxylase biotin carboxyl carrier protein [Lactobacillus sp. ESL0261]
MTFEEIEKLIAEINQSDITKLDLDFKGGHIKIDKSQVAAPVELGEESPVGQSSVKTLQETNHQELSNLDTSKQKTLKIKAPLVGIVYLQASPEKPQYKKPGDHVNKGDVVCVIEAMKMMTEIKSDFTGTIDKILVTNEQVVEYDQPLITVIPE